MHPMRAGDLAACLESAIFGDPDLSVAGVGEPWQCDDRDLAILIDPRRESEWRTSRAQVFLVSRFQAELPSAQKTQIVAADGRRALGRVLELLSSGERASAAQPTRVDPRAAVDPTANIADGAVVGPFAYVGARVRVGAGATIAPFVYVGDDASIGSGCFIGPGAVIEARCSVADHTVVGPGAVIGYRGFGFYTEGSERRPMRSSGGVSIGRNVEIGANSCVDAGTLAPTRVGDGSKIDNLVQVGHNVRIGADATLCAQVGLAGSVEVADGATLGGQVGVADHLRIGARAKVGGGSGVARHVDDGQVVSGYPAFEHVRWLRSSALLPRLTELLRDVHELKRQVAALSERAAEHATDSS